MTFPAHNLVTMADQPSPDDVTAAERILGAATIRMMELRPDDVLVILYPDKLSAAAAAAVKQVIREGLEHQRVLILDSGADLAVLRPEDMAKAEG
jgi:hypothetical protein